MNFKKQTVLSDWRGRSSTRKIEEDNLQRMRRPGMKPAGEGTGGQCRGRAMLLTERTFKYKWSRVIGVAGVAHGKSRRRLHKRMRRTKPAGEHTKRNNSCSKNRGHLGICSEYLGFQRNALEFSKCQMLGQTCRTI